MSKTKGIFITATGTDIGKTYVTGLIVKMLRDYGINAGYYKAAVSGAELINGQLVAGDAAYVAKVSGLNQKPNSLVSYIYETAVSPHLAAQIHNIPIEMSVITADFAKSKTQFSYVTVEGSGGIVCPLRLDDKTIMLIDVIKQLKLAVIIIASASLGTINSVVLTVEYALHHNIIVKGIILNEYDQENFLHQDNKKQIEHLTGISVIACVARNDTNLNIDINLLSNLYQEV
jgi:dethiobiotin synthetase